MYKKFIAIIIITLVSVFVSSAAIAEKANVVLAGEHCRLAGPKNVAELKEFSKKPVRAAKSTKIGGLGTTGSVLRTKNMVKNNQAAFSVVSVDVIDCDEQYLATIQLASDANSLMAATLITNGNAIGHRFATSGSYYWVATMQLKGQIFYIVTSDWDDDGTEELCLLVGSALSCGYRVNPNPEDGDDDYSDDDDNGGDASDDDDNNDGQEEGVPNPTLRPRNPSTTTESTGAPAPALRGR